MKLSAAGIRIGYRGVPILRDFHLQVNTGEFVSIVGPSGCGKSTLLNLIAGLLPREGGRVLVDGVESNGLSDRFALMPQDDLLLPWMTVMENVCLYGKVRGGFKDLRARALHSLSVFGLDGYENRYPHELSGGMRQRAAFLRTALCPAEILLLDEPFASLDVITREELQDWLLQMRQELNRTVVLVTHDIDEAIYLSDRVLVLDGRPAEIHLERMIQAPLRDRAWLFDQGELRQSLYATLKEGRHAF
jgi:ABC-type nitrate/sulfonate/bicarbonate transport system ATPase subunit